MASRCPITILAIVIMSANMANAQVAAPPGGEAVRPLNAEGPLKGTNTFSERDVRGRLEGAGYTRIMGLRLDDDGIWRGTAMRDKTMLPFSLDYRMAIFER
jgi:hypothetical protein